MCMCIIFMGGMNVFYGSKPHTATIVIMDNPIISVKCIMSNCNETLWKGSRDKCVTDGVTWTSAAAIRPLYAQISKART
jgi:hypothetical protein